MALPKNHQRFQQYQDNVDNHLTDIIRLYFNEEWSLMELCKKFKLPRARVERTLLEQGYNLRGLSSRTSRSLKKSKTQCLEKYGVDNVSKLEKNKKKKSELNKQNYSNAGNSDKQKWIMYVLRRGSHPDDRLAYNTYKDKVRQLTRKTQKRIPVPHKCYYTNIPFNLSGYNNDWYPSVDHKISILYGFLNKYLPEQIAKEDNLCYCARIVNSLKKELTEQEFLSTPIINRIVEYYENQKRKTNSN